MKKRNLFAKKVFPCNNHTYILAEQIDDRSKQCIVILRDKKDGEEFIDIHPLNFKVKDMIEHPFRV